MTDTTGKEIIIEGVDTRELYGAKECYLQQIVAMHPKLKIVARGSSLKVLGAKGDVERFERQMAGLIAYYDRYGHISKEVVEQSFAAGFAEASEAAHKSDKEVIVYGNNG
ncbi:MAG: phosphate starvation-inducible protein PhoH, partial [Alistipes sp.]|nr:phosphate starvation-inducible protein PhoH [Alistipes sp.]